MNICNYFRQCQYYQLASFGIKMRCCNTVLYVLNLSYIFFKWPKSILSNVYYKIGYIKSNAALMNTENMSLFPSYLITLNFYTNYSYGILN